MAPIEPFRMERYQSLYWHRVDYDLSESGVTPLSIAELLSLAGSAASEEVLGLRLGYPLSEGSVATREAIAAWYPGATADDVTVTNGGSEANLVVLWALLEPGDRLAFMVPNYAQGAGLGPVFGEAVDPVPLVLQAGRWRLDLDALERAVGPATKVIMVCNPNNPTGSVLTSEEMDALIGAAERVGAWLVADEIYRGAELAGDEPTPTFWGRTDRAVITSGLSKAFGMPGLRIGWVVAPPEVIARVWERHDYTTLSPGAVSDRLTQVAMTPEVRERILARTRGIVRANLPRLEAWMREVPSLTFVAPEAGAICYAPYDLPIDPSELAERIRLERSVLLVPGDMFGLDPAGAGRGLRFGYGFDMDHTLAGLARVAEELALVRAA
jgi:aspartate/methionine/tyrosine aminotransferase